MIYIVTVYINHFKKYFEIYIDHKKDKNNYTIMFIFLNVYSYHKM